LDFVGGLNIDALPEGVERSDPEVGIVNHRGVGHTTIGGMLEFEPDLSIFCSTSCCTFCDMFSHLDSTFG